MASLTVRTVQALTKAGVPGKFGDGRCLYLKVQPKGEPYWMLRYTIHSRRRDLLASLSVPPLVAKRCLNHKLKGVEGIYERHDYFDEKRETLLRVVAEIRFINERYD